MVFSRQSIENFVQHADIEDLPAIYELWRTDTAIRSHLIKLRRRDAEIDRALYSREATTGRRSFGTR